MFQPKRQSASSVAGAFFISTKDIKITSVTPLDCKPTESNSYREIQLRTKEFKAIIDEDLFNIVNSKNWYALKNHTNGRMVSVYAYTKINDKTVLMHRFIFDYLKIAIPERKQIDHKNHNGLDNRLKNLRVANQSQNNQNRRLSGTKPKNTIGTNWNKRDKLWYAGIKVNGKLKYLGCFKERNHAHSAYMAGLQKHYGEFVNI